MSEDVECDTPAAWGNMCLPCKTYKAICPKSGCIAHGSINSVVKSEFIYYKITAMSFGGPNDDVEMYKTKFGERKYDSANI